ncbi:MAG: hypothetical protein ACXAD7_26495 [Candidatus Kariarchaeaceae archaeon]|jgi:hypothetical protein
MFKEVELEKIEKDFSRISLAPEQRGIVDGIAEIMSQFLDISKLALKGFCWKAIQNWQVINQKDLAELSQASPEERLQHTESMFQKIGTDLHTVLHNRADENKVDTAVNQGFEFYKQSFAKR